MEEMVYIAFFRNTQEYILLFLEENGYEHKSTYIMIIFKII